MRRTRARPNVVKHRLVRTRRGTSRGQGAVRVGHAGLGGHALRRLDALDDRPGAIREQPDPFFTLGYSSITPYNSGSSGHDRHLHRRHLATNSRGSADRGPRRWFDPSVYSVPRTGSSRQHQEEQLRGPARGGQPGRLQDVIRRTSSGCSSPPRWTTPSTIRILGGSQLELHRPDGLLINGIDNNGSMGVLGSER